MSCCFDLLIDCLDLVVLDVLPAWLALKSAGAVIFLLFFVCSEESLTASVHLIHILPEVLWDFLPRDPRLGCWSLVSWWTCRNLRWI